MPRFKNDAMPVVFALFLPACAGSDATQSARIARPPAAADREAPTAAPAELCDGRPCTPPRVTRLSVGGAHACVVTDEGKPYCWGRNESHQLGDGTANLRTRPTAVVGFDGRAREIFAGDSGTCALTEEDELVCWGRVGDRHLEQPTKIDGMKAAAVAFGGSHTCVALPNGSVRCTGGNGYGQLGDGTKQPATGGTFVTVAGVSDARAVAANLSMSCALQQSGETKCWGSPHFEKKLASLSPITISGLPALSSIVPCGQSMCGLSRDGALFSWGDSDQSPWQAQRAEAWPRLRAFSGGTRACGIDEQRKLHCILDGAPFKSTTAPVELTSTPPVSAGAVVDGGMSAVCLLDDGEVRCAGGNEYGQLGIGEAATITEPFVVPNVDDVRAVLPFGSATCVLKGNGHVACWGLGPSQWMPPFGGFERRTDGTTPIEIEGITDAKALVHGPGPWQACATLARGELVCFTAGKFAFPEAPADKGRDYLPRTVLGVRDVVTAVPVRGGALAVLSNGNVVSFSASPNTRQEGSRLVADAFVRPLEGLRDVTQLAVAAKKACALHKDGTVDCWTLYDASTKELAKPDLVRIEGFRGAIDLTTTFHDFFAIGKDGTVWKFRIDPVSDGPVASGTTATVDPSLAGTKAVTHRGGGCFFRGTGVDCNRDFDLPPSAPVGEAARYHMDISDVASIEAVGNVCAIRKDKRIACWGKNFGGGLGAPDRENSKAFVKVELAR